ncbi:FMN-dependent NADH-azoreductase 2 [Mycobacteroides abscessus subsp. abscessus]|nr:FMN-dependent NADH-azoreductase 2 [Mycobacteroides abscessus subsp. abscessus]
MSEKYVSTLLAFFGVQDVTSIVTEGHNQFPDKAEEIISEGIKQAADTAAKF